MDRLWDKTVITDSGCLEFTGATNYGYGVMGAEGGERRTVRTHRQAYIEIVGPIPEGLDLDHLCRNRACWRPDHLEPVSRAENMARGIHANRSKTHCKHGHAFDEKNTYRLTLPNGINRRYCRTCQAAGAIRYYKRLLDEE